MQQSEDFTCFLLGRARAGVLRTLLARPEERFSARDLAAAATLSEGAVRHEARMLEALGLLVLHATRPQPARYQANAKHAAFSHLQQLFACGTSTNAGPARER